MGHLSSDGRPFTPAELSALERAAVHLSLASLPVPPLALDVPLLQRWHVLLSAGLPQLRPGQLRHTDITFGSFFGTAPTLIPTHLQTLIQVHQVQWTDLTLGGTDDEVLEHATWVHAELLRIHPFWDGNGRLARHLQQWLCWQGGLPAPHYQHRPSYLAGLNRYHHTRDLTLLMDVTRQALASTS